MNITWVKPIGMQAALLPCGQTGGAVPVYPDSPRGAKLRAIRLNARLGLNDAAERLGVTAVELSAVERGAAILDEDDWKSACRILEELP